MEQQPIMSNSNTSLNMTKSATLAVILLAMAVDSVSAKQKASVKIFADTTAYTPGEPFDIAIQFTIDEPWHIYWKNPGDAGMAPIAKWELPASIEASPFKFPIPKRHVDAADLTTFIHEGKPVLITTISPPANVTRKPESLDGGYWGSQSSITISGELKWLVCDTQCLMEKGSVTLTLPVAKSPTDAKPANEDLFRRARKKLPVSMDAAKWVTLKPSFGKGHLAPEQEFEINLGVQIKKGVHIQSHKPLMPGLIATDVMMHPAKNIYFDAPIKFPKPTLKDAPKLGRGAKISEFAGSITIGIPGEADEELTGASRTIGGIFIYQACADQKGTCFPKEAVEWSLEVPITSASADGSATTLHSHTDPEPSHATQPIDPTIVASTENHQDHNNDHGATPDDQATTVPEKPSTQSPPQEDGLAGFLRTLGIPGMLLGCLIYGLVLNATPCVLPVLSIKVLGFVQQAHESRRRTALLGLSFGTGVILFFTFLGLLASQGTNVLHFPVVIILLATVVMTMALSMLGVFTLQVPTSATKLDSSIQKEGMAASFGKGLLTPVLGFACTGPMLAGFFGWATGQPPRIAILAFALAGLGMASPYMILSANPNWLKFVPRPGQWMITFERIMGFMLMAMVVWLMHPLIHQIGSEGFEWTLAFLVAMAMSCWLLGKIDFSMSAPMRWKYRAGAMTIAATAGVLIYGVIYPIGENIERIEEERSSRFTSSNDWSHSVPWQPWSQAAVERDVRDGHIVFVDFTAAYCTVCKANKKIAINTQPILNKLQELKVKVYQGDFSTGDEDVFEVLQKFERGGVPLNLIYRPYAPDDPMVLSTNLTPSYLAEKLDRAAASVSSSK